MVWPGRVSVVYGIAKIGKSELLSQGLAALFTQGTRRVVAEHIGCSKSDVVKTVAKNRGEVLDEITKMHGIGMLRVEVVKNRHSLFPGVLPTDPE